MNELVDPSGSTAQILAGAASEVAPILLGARVRAGEVCVEITEVEAYAGDQDPGSHAFRGPTPRTQVMFGPPGTAYVYLSYGIHRCLNVVVGPNGHAAAVLIRAGRVVGGLDIARQRRATARRSALPDQALARGPGALGQALGIELRHNGVNLLDHEDGSGVHLSLPAASSMPAHEVMSGPRVGVAGAGGEAAAFPWRYWLVGEPSVSAYRAATRRTATVQKGAGKPSGQRRGG